MPVAIAHFMGAHWVPRPWPPCRSPGPRFLFSRPTCSLSLRLSPVTRASPPTRSQAVTRRLSGGGPGCYSPPVWRKPEARATLELPFKFKSQAPIVLIATEIRPGPGPGRRASSGASAQPEVDIARQ